jgi:hypothetical protein
MNRIAAKTGNTGIDYGCHSSNRASVGGSVGIGMSRMLEPPSSTNYHLLIESPSLRRALAATGFESIHDVNQLMERLLSGPKTAARCNHAPGATQRASSLFAPQTAPLIAWKRCELLRHPCGLGFSRGRLG